MTARRRSSFRTLTALGTVFVFTVLAPSTARAWGYEGHQIVNQLALAGLPEDFPAFVREPVAAERIAFLSAEPDRWRNNLEPGFQNGTFPDHFIDLEYLPKLGIDPRKLTPFRYDFAVQYATARAAKPDALPPINPAFNEDHTQIWPGFAPWAVFEHYAKLQSTFSTLRTYEQYGGTPAEIANSRASAIDVMGKMGHFVGDLSQPLHTTGHFNGWVGPNPEGYRTNDTIHGWIDYGFIGRTGMTFADVADRARPAQALPTGSAEDGRPRVFLAILDYLFEQHQLVVPLYQLEKEQGFNPEIDGGKRGREFIRRQWLTGGEMLSSLWLTAWRSTTPDVFLMGTLQRRAAAAEAAAKKTADEKSGEATPAPKP